MDKFVERAINEHKELTTRIVKLDSFIKKIEKDDIKEISVKDYSLMIIQLSHMKNYIDVLTTRLNIHGIVTHTEGSVVEYFEKVSENPIK